MVSKSEVKKREGLDEEIEALRALIRAAIGHQDEAVLLSDRTKLLNTVSKATLSLTQSLKLKNEIDCVEGTPADMMAKALQELEEEWPEFKQMVKKYYPSRKKAEIQ
ncbi:MAG: hypothetical protein FP831_01510 [Anaerolineae bacterium]|nr:hypothetical protein [Anaerolineae bacterium]